MADDECIQVPDQHKNLERYSLEHAAQLWALIFYRRPLYRDAAKEPDAIAHARRDLLDSGMLQLDPPPISGSGWGSTGPRESVLLGDMYASGYTPHQAEVLKRAIQIKEELNRRWIDGKDLADLFAKHGKPGVVGFDREQHAEANQNRLGGIMAFVKNLIQASIPRPSVHIHDGGDESNEHAGIDHNPPADTALAEALVKMKLGEAEPTIITATPRAETNHRTALGRRINRCAAWLKEQGVPPQDWKQLGKRGLTVGKIYKALSVYPEFFSESGHGKPITPGVFKRKFWKKQDLFKIEPSE